MTAVSRAASSGRSMRTTCTAVYGWSSRQRSIVAWNRLRRPFTRLACCATASRSGLAAPVLLHAVPDVGGVHEVGRVDAGRERALPVRAGHVGLDPVARDRVAREMLVCGSPMCVYAAGSVTLRTGAEPVARTARRRRNGPRSGSHSNANPVNSLDAVGDLAQIGNHRPLSEQDAHQLAGRDGGGIGQSQADDGRVSPLSGSTIAVRCSAARSPDSRPGWRPQNAPASSCSVRIASIPPWLWPITQRAHAFILVDTRRECRRAGGCRRSCSTNRRRPADSGSGPPGSPSRSGTARTAPW